MDRSTLFCDTSASNYSTILLMLCYLIIMFCSINLLQLTRKDVSRRKRHLTKVKQSKGLLIINGIGIPIIFRSHWK